MPFPLPAIQHDLNLFTERGLLSDHEAAQALSIASGSIPFARALNNAESIHVHINADAVTDLPGEAELLQACGEAAGDERERKFCFQSGLNVVLAIDPTAQDEFIVGAVTQSKPYVDHLGVDLREESNDTRAIFDAIPSMAAEAGWRHIYQSGPVRCCHTEMGPKHWVYPPEDINGTRRPIEFAYGELKTSDTYLGCDYRPIDPGHPMAALAATSIPSCESADHPATGRHQQSAGPPTKIYVFEERSCNASPSQALLEFLRTTYVATEIRAFDLAKPDGLVPLPPALFLALETNGSGCLPALVVDGKIRSEGWLPSPHDALRLIEHPDELASPATRPTVSEGCCSSDGCCSADSACC